MKLARARFRAMALAAAAVICALAGDARACRVVSYTFQPECFGGAPCGFDVRHPDLGAQIAVWVESADGTRFVDTLMVTSAVGIHGIGNRPGTWNMRSGPRFPYGRRQMALPIWAHARGKTYDLVVMEGGRDDQITSHEDESSPEPYFCRPMMASEVVDAITCPSGKFRSCKGVLDPSTQSYYPPRADLYDFGSTACMILPQYPGSCDAGDSAMYDFLNDVDTVATATPPFGAPFSQSWVVPADLPDGDYALYVEVGKEFDTDAANQHPSYLNAAEMINYDQYGQEGNVGAPSVLWRVPFSIGAAGTPAVAATDIAGYGDWSGGTGDVNAPDGSIGDAPGSGAGRLAIIDGPTGPGRVHVAEAACPAFDCATAPGPEPVAFEVAAEPSGTTAHLRVHQSNEGGQEVLGYDLRVSFLSAGNAPIDPSTFQDWTPAGTIPSAPPDSETDLTIGGLTPTSFYAVGVRARGICGDSPLTFQRILTPAAPHTQISGCFIATAAFGSDLEPEVRRLRALRDAVTVRSALARAAVDLYYRASPPLAALIGRSWPAGAVVRRLLRALPPWD
jgi:hypothetical protein